MIDIEEYILLTREQRRSHLRLSSKCDERGGESKQFRGLLAHFLDTTIPSGFNVYLCHACNNGKCSNVHHLYWGTPKDNYLDQVENGTTAPINDRIVAKYGKKGARSIRAKGGKANAGKPGRRYTSEQIQRNRNVIVKYDTSVRGWIGKCAKELNISHTQLRRFMNAHAKDLMPV